jgi:RNA polymerase sigma-70 factor (ECF subfamily)
MENINSYLKRYKNSGDKVWFEKIYHHYMPKIYRFYYFKLMDKQTAEDLTSELFIRVYKGLRKTNLNSKTFNIWTYRIANNLLIDHFRKMGKVDEYNAASEKFDDLTKGSFSTNSSFIRGELGFENHKLVTAIDRLSKLQRDVILLKFVEEMDYDTIARVLKKRKATVRGIVFRAITKLKTEIKEEHE